MGEDSIAKTMPWYNMTLVVTAVEHSSHQMERFPDVMTQKHHCSISKLKLKLNDKQNMSAPCCSRTLCF